MFSNLRLQAFFSDAHPENVQAEMNDPLKAASPGILKNL